MLAIIHKLIGNPGTSYAPPWAASLLPRECLGCEPTQWVLPPVCSACMAILFSLFRRFRSSASHKWQNSHSVPYLHPTTFQKKAHGLQVPWKCRTDPLLCGCGPTSSASARGRGAVCSGVVRDLSTRGSCACTGASSLGDGRSGMAAKSSRSVASRPPAGQDQERLLRWKPCIKVSFRNGVSRKVFRMRQLTGDARPYSSRLISLPKELLPAEVLLASLCSPRLLTSGAAVEAKDRFSIGRQGAFPIIPPMIWLAPALDKGRQNYAAG